MFLITEKNPIPNSTFKMYYVGGVQFAESLIVKGGDILLTKNGRSRHYSNHIDAEIAVQKTADKLVKEKAFWHVPAGYYRLDNNGRKHFIK